MDGPWDQPIALAKYLYVVVLIDIVFVGNKSQQQEYFHVKGNGSSSISTRNVHFDMEVLLL